MIFFYIHIILGFAQLISVIEVMVLFKYRLHTKIIWLVFVIKFVIKYSVLTLILVKVFVIFLCFISFSSRFVYFYFSFNNV